jgi:protocatechuate 3,4-dioxygenase beta subunit
VKTETLCLRGLYFLRQDVGCCTNFMLVATATTDAIGQYLFTNLNAGNYYVVFSNLPASYTAATANVGANDAIDSDGGAIVSGSSTTTLYTLAPGEDNLTVEFGVVPPANTNTLGNFVWFDLNSNGLQDASEPGVPGVMAVLMDAAGNIIDRDGNGTNGVQPFVATTDANGFYRFVGLSDGTYRVQFTNLPAGFSLTTPSATNTTNGSDADLSNARTIPVALGSSNRNDLTLDAGLVSTRAALGNYVWDDVNRDGIQDAGEPAVSGVTVTLFAADGTTVLASAITNASGQYLFPNLTAGNYVVGFSTLPRGTEFTTANATAENLGTDSDADAVTGRTAVITLTAGEVNLNVDAGIRTIIPASVGDYVWLDINSNGLQEANEPGVGGVIATLYDAGNNVVGSAITDGKGNYLITNVTPGNGYYIIFSNLPGGSFTTQNVGGTTAANNSNANGSGQTLAFNVTPGAAIREIDAGIVGWPSGGVLPIGLLKFTAEKQRESVLLRWTTSNEINTAFMEIERSADGRVFQSIGRVQAAGFSSTELDYQLPDARPFTGWNYYRLKTTDLDGQVSYSVVRTVRFVGAQELMVYPNPVRDVAQIQLPKSWLNQDVTVRVLSATGQELKQWRMRPVQTQQQLRLDELAAGSYLLQFNTSGESIINRTVQVIR